MLLRPVLMPILRNPLQGIADGIRNMLAELLGSSQFFAPLTHSLVLARGTGSPTFTRASTATVMGYGPTDNAVDGLKLLTVAANEARFVGARRISEGVWSNTFADGSLIPAATNTGYLVEGARTNHFLNSTAPVTQTSGALTAGTYTLWMEGTGSVAVAGNTATITGAGTATDGTPVTFVVTVGGTVDYTVTGTPTRVQAENGAFASSFITTAGTAVTRAADVLTYPSAGNISFTVGSAYAELSTNWTAVQAGGSQALGTGTVSVGPFLNSATGVSTGLRVFDGTNVADDASTLDMYLVPRKRAARWGSDIALCADGGTVVTGTFDGSMGSVLYVGCAGDTTQQWQGTMRNVRIWQRALSSSELQAITA